MDCGKSELVPFAELIDELIGIVAEDAKELGCLDQVEHVRNIALNGNSADRQRAAYRSVTKAGGSQEDALRAVVELLVSEYVS